MGFIWDELRDAVPLIVHGNPQLWQIIWFTLQVAAIATAAATVIGVPIGLRDRAGTVSGAGASRTRSRTRAWRFRPWWSASSSTSCSSRAPHLGRLQLIWTREIVFIAQTILALPFTVALTAAAVQALPPGLLGQARLLGAGRLQVSMLALREARIGVMAGIIAALGTALSEVAAVAILGGNIYGYNQTLASCVSLRGQRRPLR